MLYYTKMSDAPARAIPASARIALALAAVLALGLAPGASAQPRVVASILPLQSLGAGVMEGVATPEVLVRGAASPHTYTLKPSDARALAQAQIVFWIGPGYETFLKKPLAALSKKAKLVELIATPGVIVLPTREGGVWAGHDEPASRARPRPGRGTADLDSHIFLDPMNAKAIVRAAVAALGEADPANEARYRANATRLAERIEAADTEHRLMLGPVRSRPFVVFHDAYQYFERHYGLAAVGSIALSPERPPGAQRLAQLKRKIRDLGAVCVFAEPQFQPALVATLIDGTAAKTGLLDPLGATLAPGPDAYFELMRGLARALAGCLAD